MANTKITSRVIADNAVGISALAVSDGSDGQVLTTNGSGTLSFATVSGTTINNNADNRIITGSGTANTLNGETGLTYNGSTLAVTGAITSDSTVTSLTSFNSTSGNDLRLNAGSANRDIFMQVNGTTHMTVQGSTGNVGIGKTPNRSRKLEVAGTMNLDDGSEYEWGDGSISIGGNSSTDVMTFATTSAVRMKILSTGGAQFYTALRSNAKKMELHNGEGLYVYNNGGGNPVDYGSGSEIRLDGLSHGINATHYLALSGYLPGYTPGQYNCLKTDLSDMHFAAGGSYTGYIGANTGFTDVSDEREKENITTITNATEKLKQLRGVYHTWKDTTNRGTDTHIGLIAQEVEAVVPQVVSTSNPTSLNTPESDTAGLKGVAYAKLVPLLIETIKELEARITELENA